MLVTYRCPFCKVAENYKINLSKVENHKLEIPCTVCESTFTAIVPDWLIDSIKIEEEEQHNVRE